MCVHVCVWRLAGDLIHVCACVCVEAGQGSNSCVCMCVCGGWPGI